MHNSFSQKNLTAILVLAPAANMLDTSQFFFSWMKRKHAVILESICETDFIIIFLPFSQRGLRTPLLTCFTLLFFSLLLEEIILSPPPFLRFTLLDKIIPRPIHLPFGQSYSTSKFPLLFALPGQKILSPTPNPKNFSHTISFSVLAANPYQSYKKILSPTFF